MRQVKNFKNCGGFRPADLNLPIKRTGLHILGKMPSSAAECEPIVLAALADRQRRAQHVVARIAKISDYYTGLALSSLCKQGKVRRVTVGTQLKYEIMPAPRTEHEGDPFETF